MAELAVVEENKMKIDAWTNYRSTSVAKAAVTAPQARNSEPLRFVEQDFKAQKTGSEVEQRERERLSNKTYVGDIVAKAVIQSVANYATTSIKKSQADKTSVEESSAATVGINAGSAFAATSQADSVFGGTNQWSVKDKKVILDIDKGVENIQQKFKDDFAAFKEANEDSKHYPVAEAAYLEKASVASSLEQKKYVDNAIASARASLNVADQKIIDEATSNKQVDDAVERMKSKTFNGEQFTPDFDLEGIRDKGYISVQTNGIEALIKTARSYVGNPNFIEASSAAAEAIDSAIYSLVPEDERDAYKADLVSMMKDNKEITEARQLENYIQDGLSGNWDMDNLVAKYGGKRAVKITDRFANNRGSGKEPTAMQKMVKVNEMDALIRRAKQGELGSFDEMAVTLLDYVGNNNTQYDVGLINDFLETIPTKQVAASLVVVTAWAKTLGGGFDIGENAINKMMASEAYSQEQIKQFLMIRERAESVIAETTAGLLDGTIKREAKVYEKHMRDFLYSSQAMTSDVADIDGVGDNGMDTDWKVIIREMKAKKSILDKGRNFASNYASNDRLGTTAEADNFAAEYNKTNVHASLRPDIKSDWTAAKNKVDRQLKVVESVAYIFIMMKEVYPNDIKATETNKPTVKWGGAG